MNKTLDELFKVCDGSWGILLNHTLAAPFNVVGNALHITSFEVICSSINILNDSMWSKGSLEPSYNSNYGRRNFGERGQFSTSVVKVEFILRIIPSWFSSPLSFIALFSSSTSFLMLRSLFSIRVESSPKVLSYQLVWEFDSSFWFSPIRQRSTFWDSIVFHSSSFWRVFHISQKGLDLLLLHSIWLRYSFYFHLVLRGTLLSLGKMAWMISDSHRRRQIDDVKNQQLSSLS